MLPPMLATTRNAASGCKARLRWAWPLPLVWRCHSYQAWPPANAPRPWAQRTSALVPGVTKVVEWRGKSVWLLKRPPEQLADLEKINGLADPASVKSVQPEYARNTHRSIKPEVLGRWASALTWAAHPATWPKAATPPAQAQHNQTADKLEPASALFIESAQAQGQHRAADYQAIVCQIPQNVEYQVTVVGRC